jgi:hypothetical protein
MRSQRPLEHPRSAALAVPENTCLLRTAVKEGKRKNYACLSGVQAGSEFKGLLEFTQGLNLKGYGGSELEGSQRI